jgi:hypothetical protein
MIISPRQAADKHKEKEREESGVFLQGTTQVEWVVIPMEESDARAHALVYCRGTLMRNSGGAPCIVAGVYGRDTFGSSDLGMFAGERVGDRAAGAEPSIKHLPPEPEPQGDTDSDLSDASSDDDGAEGEADAAEWVCVACTFINAPDSTECCEMCETPRPPAAAVGGEDVDGCSGGEAESEAPPIPDLETEGEGE